MRNKNIFVRKESAFSCVHGNNLPVFANVTALDSNGNVHYGVDYPEPVKKDWQWHYADNSQRSGTYVVPLDKFLSRFMPDYDNIYSQFL